MKQDIFMGKTFALTRESYKDVAEAEIILIEKTIIENGGRVIDDTTKSQMLLQEDGFDQSRWKNHHEGSNQIVIHFRWV